VLDEWKLAGCPTSCRRREDREEVAKEEDDRQPCWRAIKWQKNKKLSISNNKKLNTILRGVFG
jgi:hypothetical protein